MLVAWEPAYRLLMKASLGSGNRSQAVRAYEQCVRTLQTELGVEPDEETTAVYKQVVAGGRGDEGRRARSER